jgi:hypothetical protein
MGPPDHINPVSETVSQRVNTRAAPPANLERDKPNAFHSVADEEKVLETPERGYVNSHIHESHPNKTLVQIKRPHENLRWRGGVNAGLSKRPRTRRDISHLLPHGRHQVPIHATESRYRTLGVLSAVQPKFMSSVPVGSRVRYDFHDLEDVRLGVPIEISTRATLWACPLAKKKHSQRRELPSLPRDGCSSPQQ